MKTQFYYLCINVYLFSSALKDNNIQFYICGGEPEIVAKAGALASTPAEIFVRENDLEKALDLIEVVLLQK